MSEAAYIGCDPGMAGGIAIIYPNGDISAFPMPDTERDLFDLMQELSGLYADIRAAVEAVHSMPRQGVASSFKFGMGYGSLRMAVIASGLPLRSVTPQAWQKELQCLTKGDKMVSLRRAQELFPAFDWPKTKGAKLCLADAMLIAEWLRRTERGV